MFRKSLIVVLALAAIVTGFEWISLMSAGTYSTSRDMHFAGFALTWGAPQLRLLSYRSYASVAIPIQRKARPQYNLLIIPLWSLFVAFSLYPFSVFCAQAKRRRFVERRWFAITAGMAGFFIAVLPTIWLTIDSRFYRWVANITGSDDAALVVALVLIAVVPAMGALLTHGMIAGPLRRISLRKPKVCSNCTYNLTGNVSGVCPECGKPTPCLE